MTGDRQTFVWFMVLYAVYFRSLQFIKNNYVYSRFFISYYDYRPFKNTLLNKVCGNATKIGACVGQYILPLWFKAFPCWKISNSQKENVVVCLTSFPRRIGVVWLVIECLMRQSIHASCIVLYLSKKQFTENTIPKRLQEYQRRGILKIRLVDEDIRSHKSIGMQYQNILVCPLSQ